MQIGDIINLGYLTEQGYTYIDTTKEGHLAYTHLKKGIDLKIGKTEMPEIYKVLIMYHIKDLKEEIRGKE